MLSVVFFYVMDKPYQQKCHGPRLLDQVRQRIQSLHYSNRTEKTYIGWIKRFILYHGKRHPVEMGEKSTQCP
ncbi:MAG: phage integrase N-terminal SAM-like domain-containing protein [Acidobacteria bacterium]|nr:phage integrase N-terminal SAM-like domain-containing protein [Acidobacteriota bacterium]